MNRAPNHAIGTLVTSEASWFRFLFFLAMAEGFAFGEFSFSSFRSSHPLATLDPVADGDVWGDFVKSPQQSQSADPPINSFTGKGNSPLALMPRWVKPSGVLPLSFFGVAEEEEEKEGKDAADFNLGRSNVGVVNFNLAFNDNSKYLSAGNLFSHTSHINRENGPDSKSADRSGTSRFRGGSRWIRITVVPSYFHCSHMGRGGSNVGRGGGRGGGRGRGRGRGVARGRKIVEKSADELDKDLDHYHAEAMQS